jgi:hypothetical protein
VRNDVTAALRHSPPRFPARPGGCFASEHHGRDGSSSPRSELRSRVVAACPVLTGSQTKQGLPRAPAGKQPPSITHPAHTQASASSAHRWLSPQGKGPPETHAPARHWSPVVQKRPSSHAVPSSPRRSTQVPAPSQLSAASQPSAASIPAASLQGVPSCRSFGAQKPSASQVSRGTRARLLAARLARVFFHAFSHAPSPPAPGHCYPAARSMQTAARGRPQGPSRRLPENDAAHRGGARPEFPGTDIESLVASSGIVTRGLERASSRLRDVALPEALGRGDEAHRGGTW